MELWEKSPEFPNRALELKIINPVTHSLRWRGTVNLENNEMHACKSAPVSNVGTTALCELTQTLLELDE